MIDSVTPLQEILAPPHCSKGLVLSPVGFTLSEVTLRTVEAGGEETRLAYNCLHQDVYPASSVIALD